MGWKKTSIDGKVMWQDDTGQRLHNPNEPADKCGWRKVSVDGRIMWESPDGERSQ